MRGAEPGRVLAAAGVRPDFSGGPSLRYIHRTAGETDIYFVANIQSGATEASCTFRVSGKLPELWWPETGRVEAAPAYVEQDGATSVMLRLEGSESVFVVFRKPAAKATTVVALARDGQRLWSVGEPTLKVTVHSARYGALDDPQRTRDVREKVQKLVDAGEYSFHVGRLAEGDDPAFKVVKTLEVEYEAYGRRFIVKGQDQDTVFLTGETPKIVVEKALYGVIGDKKRTRDVRAKVQSIADAGESSFAVPRLAQGDDPAYMVIKTLLLEYTVDGRKVAVRATDGDTITLAPVTAADRIVELAGGADGGGVTLEAWQPGQYEVSLASGQSRQVSVAVLPEPRDVGGPWQVRFPKGWGAPESITLEKLMSLSEHPEAGVKYFSGTAVYSKKIDVSPDLLAKGRRLYLDLGRVQVMADVTLNGKSLGRLWRPPFLVDVTDAAKAGENLLEVQVVNLWPNRLIGDEQMPEDSDRNENGTLKVWPKWLEEGKPGPTGRYTFTSWRLWKKDSPLPDSGLIGPVMLRSAARVGVSEK